MFKFLHAADIHLDSPLRNLDYYDGAPVDVFRNATRQAFDRMIELAVDEQVRFVLVAGDLYDGDCRDSEDPAALSSANRQIGRTRIQVFVIQGNHDAGLGRQEFRFQLPANVVFIFHTDSGNASPRRTWRGPPWTGLRRTSDHGRFGGQLPRSHSRLSEYWTVAYQLRHTAGTRHVRRPRPYAA